MNLILIIGFRSWPADVLGAELVYCGTSTAAANDAMQNAAARGLVLKRVLTPIFLSVSPPAAAPPPPAQPEPAAKPKKK